MKTNILTGLFVMLSLFLLNAGGSKDRVELENPGRPVKIAVLNGPSGIGMIQLMADPPLQDRDITVETVVVGAPKVLLGQLINEEWDFASLPANMAAILFNRGIPYNIAAVTGLGNLYLIAEKGYGKVGMEDLKDKTVFIPGKNTTPDLIMQLLCDKHHVAMNYDYSFNPSDLAKALIGNVADIAILPEPMATLALSKNPNLIVAADLQEFWKESYPDEGVFPITVMIVKTDFEQNNPALTREIMNAAEDSIHWVMDNPGDASVLIGEHGFLLPPKVVEKSIPGSHYAFLTGEDAIASADPYFKEIFRINPAALGGAVPADTLYLK